MLTRVALALALAALYGAALEAPASPYPVKPVRFVRLGAEVVAGSLQALAAQLTREIASWDRVIKAAGIRAD